MQLFKEHSKPILRTGNGLISPSKTTDGGASVSPCRELLRTYGLLLPLPVSTHCIVNYNSTHRTFAAAFEWDALPAGSVVVDVGGGLGFGRYSMDIAMQHPNLQIIVQQSGPFVEEGQKVH